MHKCKLFSKSARSSTLEVGKEGLLTMVDCEIKNGIGTHCTVVAEKDSKGREILSLANNKFKYFGNAFNDVDGDESEEGFCFEGEFDDKQLFIKKFKSNGNTITSIPSECDCKYFIVSYLFH